MSNSILEDDGSDHWRMAKFEQFSPNNSPQSPSTISSHSDISHMSFRTEYSRRTGLSDSGPMISMRVRFFIVIIIIIIIIYLFCFVDPVLLAVGSQTYQLHLKIQLSALLILGMLSFGNIVFDVTGSARKFESQLDDIEKVPGGPRGL